MQRPCLVIHGITCSSLFLEVHVPQSFTQNIRRRIHWSQTMTDTVHETLTEEIVPRFQCHIKHIQSPQDKSHIQTLLWQFETQVKSWITVLDTMQHCVQNTVCKQSPKQSCPSITFTFHLTTTDKSITFYM